MSGLKVTRIATAGQELAGGYALDATYAGEDADVTSGLPLDGLLDVNAPAPADGDGIVWDDGAGEWVNTHALTESDVVALLTPDIYACVSLTATTGTIAAGAHTDLHAVGGTTVQINEVTGSPGFDIRAAFTGVDGLTDVFVHCYYTATHTVVLQLYNYDTTTWDTVLTLGTSQTEMQLYHTAIADGSPYFDGSENAEVRFYHADTGNITHRLYIDYLAISHSTGTTGGLALNDLTDVDTTGKSDQDVLTWDNGTTTWVAAAAPSGSGIPATLIDAKGDLIVGSAADTAARLAVGGTNGHVLTVDSGETTGVKWAAPAASGATDPVADLFGTPATAYEFATSSLSGLTALGTPATENADTTVADCLYLYDNVSGDDWAGRYIAKTAASAFTFITRVVDHNVRANYNAAGLFVGETTPGKMTTFMLNAVGPVLKSVKYSSPTSFSADLTSAETQQEVHFLAIVVNSTSDIDLWASRTGSVWWKHGDAKNPGLTIGSIGLCLASNNTAGCAAAFDYLRVWDSALTFPGG